MAHNIQIFVGVMVILLMLAVFIPFVKQAINESYNSQDVSLFERTILGESYLSIVANIIVIPFWTFGLNTWLNILVLLPLRVAGILSIWYSGIPTKS